MQALRKFSDAVFGGTKISKKILRCKIEQLNKPFSDLISEELKKSGNSDNEGKYKALLSKLLPESILSPIQKFSSLNTVIKNLATNDVKRKKIFNEITEANNNAFVLTEGNNTYNIPRGYELAKTLKERETVLTSADAQYRKSLYFVCCNLIKHKDIFKELSSVVEVVEQSTESPARQKMYLEALMNYIVFQCLKDDVEIGNNFFKFKDKDIQNDILYTLEVVKKIFTKKTLMKHDTEIKNKILKFTAFSDKDISSKDIIDDIDDDINEDVLKDADIDISVAIELKNDIISNITDAFENTKDTAYNVHNDRIYNQKSDVIKQLKEVNKKIFASKDTSAELIKKFVNEPAITKMKNTVKTKHNVDPAAQGVGSVVGHIVSCRSKYYAGEAVGDQNGDVRQKLADVRDHSVANTALKDEEFRKRLDEEIKAKIKSSPNYFSGALAVGGLGIGNSVSFPFGSANAVLCDDNLGNVYTKNAPYIAHVNAMSYVEEHYITYLKQRLQVFNKASDLQKEDDTKWIGDVIVDLKTGLWIDKDNLKELMDDITKYSKELFEDVEFDIDTKQKKEILTEIIKTINEKSLKTRGYVYLRECVRDVFNRVKISIQECETEEDIQRLKKDVLKNDILKYQALSDANKASFENAFKKVLAHTLLNYDANDNLRAIYNGTQEICHLLLANISDKSELFKTLRAVIAMADYIYNNNMVEDKRRENFDKFSEFIKNCVSKNNTQDIINYAKMHLPDFYNPCPVNHTIYHNTGRLYIANYNQIDVLRELFVCTSVEIPDDQIDDCLHELQSDNYIANIVSPTLQNLVYNKTGGINNFTDQNNNGNNDICKYTAYKRISEGLKYLLAGNYDKFKTCFSLSDDDYGTLNGKKFTSQLVEAVHPVIDDHALVAAMYRVLHDDATANRYSLVQQDINGVLSFLTPNGVAVDDTHLADKPGSAKQLQISLDGDTNVIKKIIKMCDEQAKVLSPQVDNFFRVINTPKQANAVGTEHHDSNAGKKLHMLMLSSDVKNVNRDIARGIHPFAGFEDNKSLLSPIDNNKLISNGVRPTSLFFQHNRSLEKDVNYIDNFDITESADEVINPVVRQIVTRGVKKIHGGWWKVSEVKQLTELAEQYRLTEDDVDDLFENCPVLLGNCNIDVIRAYLDLTKHTLKDSPDLAKNYKTQLKKLYEQIHKYVIEKAFTNDVHDIDSGTINAVMLSLLKQCKNAHQLYAIYVKLEKANNNDKQTIVNKIINNDIVSELPVLEQNAKTKGKIKVKKDGKEYELSVLKTSMKSDPHEKYLNNLAGGRQQHNPELKNIRRKFLDTNDIFKNVFGEIGGEYQTYLELDGAVGGFEDTGKIIIAKNIDSYNVRHSKELIFDNDKADFSKLKDLYTTNVYYDSDKKTHKISVDIRGDVMVDDHILFRATDDLFKAHREEFLQTLSVWMDVFGCNNEDELYRTADKIKLYLEDGKDIKELLSRLTELQDNIHNIKYQDILRLLRDSSYSYICCPFDEDRTKMIIDLIKFKEDFICSVESEKEDCEELIYILQNGKNVSLQSMGACKHLYSFISPNVDIEDNINFLKCLDDTIEHNRYKISKMKVYGGVFKRKHDAKMMDDEIDKKAQETKKTLDGDDAKSGDVNKKKKDSEKDDNDDTKSGDVNDDKKDNNTDDKDGTKSRDRNDDKKDNQKEDKEKEQVDNYEHVDNDEELGTNKRPHNKQSLHDRFGIKKGDNRSMNNNYTKKNDNFFNQITDHFDKIIKNKEACKNNQFQFARNNQYNNTPQMPIRQSRNIFDYFTKQKDSNYTNYTIQQQNPISRYNNITPNGTLKDVFRSTYANGRRFYANSKRQNFFFEKQAQQNQAQQNNQVWQKGNGNFLQQSQQIGSYSGNRSIDGLYDGFQTRNISNASSIHTNPYRSFVTLDNSLQ